jgi:hypothetical protein
MSIRFSLKTGCDTGVCAGVHAAGGRSRGRGAPLAGAVVGAHTTDGGGSSCGEVRGCARLAGAGAGRHGGGTGGRAGETVDWLRRGGRSIGSVGPWQAGPGDGHMGPSP